ncbi:hypothetical protein WN943_005450 [Citrus x changshan-huyou]
MLQLGLCWPNEFDGNFVTVAGVSDFKLKNNLEILRLKEDDPKLLEFDESLGTTELVISETRVNIAYAWYVFVPFEAAAVVNS